MPTIDLSHEWVSGMPVFPGDPEVSIAPAATIESDAFAVAAISCGSHSGTHLDAPAHTVSGGRTIDQIALDEVMGKARVISLPRLAPNTPITELDLAPLLDGGLRGAQIVLIATHWSGYWGSAEYLAHPYLTPGAVELLVDMGMHLLGTDTLNPDSTKRVAELGLPVHDLLLGSDRLIVENLRNLELLPQVVEFGAAPIPIRRGDGAPVRAVARW